MTLDYDNVNLSFSGCFCFLQLMDHILHQGLVYYMINWSEGTGSAHITCGGAGYRSIEKIRNTPYFKNY